MTVATQERSEVQQREDAAQQQSWAVQPSTALQQFAADARAAYTTALSVAKTPFCPSSYKSSGPRNNKTYFTLEQTAATVCAAWLAGEEIGLRPMQSLAAIDVIEGRPALNAQAMRALLQSHGHEVWVEEQPVPNAPLQNMAVTVAGLRQGQPEERVQRVTWTWSRARQAGLVEKHNWQNHPIEMLIARATSAVCRLVASDVLMGLAYSVEELEDEFGVGESVPAATAPVSRRRSTGVGRAPVRVITGGQQSEEPEQPEEGEEERQDEGEEPSEEPSSPGRPTKRDDEEATEERGNLAAEPETAKCGHESGDGRFCTRDTGHTGKHFYGRQNPPVAASEPSQPETDVEELRRQRQRQRVNPEPSQPAPEALQGASVADYEPTEEERAEAEEGPEQDPLYPEISDEEQARAFEAEQEAARAREAEAQAASQPAQQQQEPPDDDPWADFR